MKEQTEDNFIMDERLIQTMMTISKELGNLNGNMNGVLTQLTQHNQRIQALEEARHTEEKTGWKEEIIKMLVKCVMIGATAFGTLVGVKNTNLGAVLNQPQQQTEATSLGNK